MSHSTEPNDEPITPKPKIVQMFVLSGMSSDRMYALTSSGRILCRIVTASENYPWIDITGEIPISGNDSGK